MQLFQSKYHTSFFSVSNEETLLRSSEDTIQQRHRHVLAHFSCNTACVYLPDLCVSVCRPVPVTPSVPDREEQVAYTADRGHRVQQIMSIKCGPRAWNTVKPSAKGREGRKRGFIRDSACVWSMLLHISNVTQISSPAKPRSSRKRAVSQCENEPWDVQKTAYSYTTLMCCQWGSEHRLILKFTQQTPSSN